jgi:uncharacterized protein YdeI (YjbR/CyaY-like superfamily)
VTTEALKPMPESAKRSFEPSSRAQWRQWLGLHAADAVGVWLVLHKGEDVPLTYEDAALEAVAVGWIDSKPNKLDERRYKLWVAPRKPGSGWSRVNKDRVASMLKDGLMTERGLAVVEAAKADGSWEALDSVLALEVPDDLRAALDLHECAAGYFDAFPPSSKRIILEWIAQTKNPETRRRRIDETVELAAKDIRAHHWRQPKR